MLQEGFCLRTKCINNNLIKTEIATTATCNYFLVIFHEGSFLSTKLKNALKLILKSKTRQLISCLLINFTYDSRRTEGKSRMLLLVSLSDRWQAEARARWMDRWCSLGGTIASNTFSVRSNVRVRDVLVYGALKVVNKFSENLISSVAGCNR